MANDRWSYQVVEIKPGFWGNHKNEPIQERLNQLGMQGWELVNAVQSGPLRPIRLFLKKPS
ncbi:MAG: DUF4177 domain-containing protein [Xanthomonadales bacterium]|nr:DUF4177 domain-containing protein [Xanthomonadales bacterium]